MEIFKSFGKNRLIMLKNSYKFEILGNKILINFSIDKYPEKRFALDLKEFRNYQFKKRIEEDEVLDLKYYKGKSEILFSYDEFLELVFNFMSKMIYNVLKERPQIITSDDLEIRVNIKRVANRAYYGVYDENKSSPESIFLEFSGLWLLQTIAYPGKYLKKIDYSVIYKFLVHELQHHKDNVAKLFRFNKRYAKRIKKLVGKDLWFSNLKFLYAVLFELREEGFADFAAKSNSPKIEVHMDWVRSFRKNVKKLAKIRDKNKASDFFDENLSILEYKGDYYCGMLMCFFIELAIAKRQGKPPFLQKKDKSYEHISSLNRFMSKEKSFFVQDPGQKFFEEAYSLIQKTRIDTFISLYNESCDKLGISQKNRVIWWQFFRVARKKAVETYNRSKSV